MPSEYTPTTEEIRVAWGYFGNDVEHWEDVQRHESAHAEFDRWLAQVKAEAGAKALEDAAEQINRDFQALPSWMESHARPATHPVPCPLARHVGDVVGAPVCGVELVVGCVRVWG